MAKVDWSAAGRKAWATRLRNLAANGQQATPKAKRERKALTRAQRSQAALKAWVTMRARYAMAHPILVVTCPNTLRQVRRILESMREFGFDPGGHWQVCVGAEGLDEGWTPRVAGDPIFNTIGQVAGVFADRDDVIEAAAALVEGRRPNLPPRMEPLPAAIKTVAEALAQDQYKVTCDDGVSVEIKGPMLPPNFDEVSTC
jgi:hypothetical protein